MNNLKAFMAGMVFPATVLPLIYLAVYLSGWLPIRLVPFQFAPLLLPLIFGIWNMLYFELGKGFPVKDQNSRLWLTGMMLGFLLALFGVSLLQLPHLLFGVIGPVMYLPLIVAPIVYGFIWRYIIKGLNNVVGLKDWDKPILSKIFRRKK